MKIIIALLLALQLGLLAGSAQIVTPEPVWRQAYQGTLSSNGVPVNVPHDVVLSLWAGPLGGTQIGVSSTNLSLPVTNGQFNALVDTWGSDDFSATNLHVQTALRRSGSGQPYVTLLPRQPLASVPRATLAARALTISSNALSTAYLGTNGVDGAIIAPGSLSGDKLAAASVVKSLNGLKDGVTLEAGDGLILTATNNTLTMWAPHDCFSYTNCYWSLFGNGNIVPGVNFMGGVAGELAPVEFRVNNTHAMRYELGAGAMTIPNIVGGDKNNKIIWHEGSVISGGGSAAQPNIISYGGFSAIGGGRGNSVSNHFSTIAGGLGNRIHGLPNAPGPGVLGFIGGGIANDLRTFTGTIGGGSYNVLNTFATNGAIVGGITNYMDGAYGFIGGGRTNRILFGSDSAVIGGGEANTVEALSDWATIGGGKANLITNSYATISGGGFNTNFGFSSTIGGGDHNVIPTGATITTVAGGRNNVASGVQSVIGGGQNNRTTTTGSAAVVAGGFNNEAGADTSAIGGGVANVITPVAANATIGGGANNNASAIAATISGGLYNTNSGISSTIGGGEYNFIAAGADRSTVAGGHLNVASGATATVSGGSFNAAVAPNSTIPGGLQALTRSYGQQAYASGQFASSGDAQSSLFVLRTNTVGNVPNAELFLDGGAANQRMMLPNNTTWTFNIMVVARSATGFSAGWEIKGVVEKLGGPAATVLCATTTPICVDAGTTGWTASVPLGVSATGALTINVNSGTANNANVRWVASVRTVEVTN